MKRLSATAASLISCASAFAAGCPEVSKGDLAKSMGISTDLVPLLSMEVADCSNISLANGFATFTLNEVNAKVHNGVRSEIAINYPFNEGDTVEYAWSVRLPSDSAPGGNADQWWLIAQWHDQPDLNLGETWASFKGQPPPLAIYVERKDGVLGIGLSSIQGKKLDWAPVQTDLWLNIKARITWSTGDNGRAQVTISGDKTIVFEHSGRNMLNAYQHYFKAGQYRAPWVQTKTTVQIKNVKFTKN